MKQTQTPVRPPLTPLERLQAGKKQLRRQCLEQEEALAADFRYIRENAAGLLLAGISALMLRGSGSSKAQQAGMNESNAREPMGLAGYLSLAGSLVPVAWSIAQPILVSWAVKRAKRWLAGLFTPRKRTGGNH